MRLEALLEPRSIAILGASVNPSLGRMLIESMDAIGYQAMPGSTTSPLRSIWSRSVSATPVSFPSMKGLPPKGSALRSFLTAALPNSARKARRCKAASSPSATKPGSPCAGPIAWACSTRTIAALPICNR